MATYQELVDAVRRADAAGDIEGAQRLADMARDIRATSVDFAPVSERTEGPLTPAIEAAEYLAGGAQQFMNTLTLGSADEIAAGLETGFGFLGDYDATLDRLRDQDQYYRETNPLSASAFQAAGAVAPAILLKAPPVMAGAPASQSLMSGLTTALGTPQTGGRLTQALTNTGILGSAGGIVGATEGFLSAEGGDRLGAAQEGALAGSILGPLFPAAPAALRKLGGLGGDALRAIQEALPPSLSRRADDVFGEALPPDANVRGINVLMQRLNDDQITPEQFMSELNAISDLASPADLGPATGGLAATIAGRSGEPRSLAREFMSDRQAGAAGRVKDQMIVSMTGDDARLYDIVEELNATRRATAAPLYEEAYSAFPMALDARINMTNAVGEVIGETTLQRMLNRPAMQQALNRAVKIAREEEVDPITLGINFNDAGDAISVSVPSWRTLDYIRRGLDDVINAAPKDPRTMRLILDQDTRAILQTRTDFNNALRGYNQPYADALDAWAGPTRALEMIGNGRIFLRGDGDDLIERFRALSPIDQEYFRLGVAQELKTKIEKALRSTDPQSRLWGTEDIQNRLTEIFPNEEALQEFVRTVEAEHLMLGTSKPVIRAADALDRSPIIPNDLLSRIGNLGSATVSLVRGSPGAALGDAARGVTPSIFRRRHEREQQEIAESLAPYIFTNDPNQLGRLSNMLLDQGRVGTVGGNVVPEMFDDQIRRLLAERLAATSAAQNN